MLPVEKRKNGLFDGTDGNNASSGGSIVYLFINLIAPSGVIAVGRLMLSSFLPLLLSFEKLNILNPTLLLFAFSILDRFKISYLQKLIVSYEVNLKSVLKKYLNNCSKNITNHIFVNMVLKIVFLFREDVIL